jgi:glycosyltransferase 2 family protein
VVVVHACILVVAGIGWAKLVQPFAPVALRVFLLLRWIRESINVLLPVAQVGGDLMGGRLLTFWRVPGGLAGASILADLVIQIAAQFLFTLVGFAVLALSGADARIIGYVASGLAISALVLCSFYCAQRLGLARIAEASLTRIAKRWPSFTLGTIPGLHENLQTIHRHPKALLASFVLHQAAWFFGVAEIWIALTCMGLKPGWGECLVLESLGQAVRSADFAIPGVMGVQEGGFLVIGNLYGIAPEISLALSLVKRVPDVALGVPGLVVWHWLERRHMQVRQRVSGPQQAMTFQDAPPNVPQTATQVANPTIS